MSDVCLKNCSCTAYANTDIRGSGSGCLLWFDELLDIREHKENSQDLYTKIAASELAKNGRSKVRFIIIPTILLTVTMMLGVCLWVIWMRRKKHTEGSILKKLILVFFFKFLLSFYCITLNVEVVGIRRLYFRNNRGYRNEDLNLKLPLFDFSTLANATNGFPTNSKLGECGFGHVYKVSSLKNMRGAGFWQLGQSITRRLAQADKKFVARSTSVLNRILKSWFKRGQRLTFWHIFSGHRARYARHISTTIPELHPTRESKLLNVFVPFSIWGIYW